MSRPRGLRTGTWLVAADGGAVRRAAGRRRAAADRGERTGSRRSCSAPLGRRSRSGRSSCAAGSRESVSRRQRLGPGFAPRVPRVLPRSSRARVGAEGGPLLPDERGAMRPAHARARLGAGRRPRARVLRRRHGQRPVRLRWARRAGPVRRRADAAAVMIETEIRGSAVTPCHARYPRVAERIGIDVEPLDLRDDRVRRWLAACIPREIGAVTRQLRQRVLRGGAATPAAGGDRRGWRAGSRLDLDRSAGCRRGTRRRTPSSAARRRAFRRALPPATVGSASSAAARTGRGGGATRSSACPLGCRLARVARPRARRLAAALTNACGWEFGAPRGARQLVGRGVEAR